MNLPGDEVFDAHWQYGRLIAPVRFKRPVVERVTMDGQYTAFLTLLLTWYVVPILVTLFMSFLCREMGIPVWCPWVVLAAYIHQSQATVIHSINQGPPEGG